MIGFKLYLYKGGGEGGLYVIDLSINNPENCEDQKTKIKMRIRE